MGPIEEEITELISTLVRPWERWQQSSPTTWFTELVQYNQDAEITAALSAIVDAVTRLAREVDQLRA